MDQESLLWSDDELTDESTPTATPGNELSGDVRADQEQWERLAAAGFTGLAMELFAERLWEYAWQPVRSWLRTGHMERLCQRRGIKLEISEEQRLALRTSAEEREALALDTIAAGVDYFLRVGLRKWRPEHGARLTTFFLSACIWMFPKQFYAWRQSRARRYAELSGGMEQILATAAAGTDPEHAAATKDSVRRIARLADESTKAILLLIARGHTQVEIAGELGLSARAVEGKLFRLRGKTINAAKRGAIVIPPGYRAAKKARRAA